MEIYLMSTVLVLSYLKNTKQAIKKSDGVIMQFKRLKTDSETM